MDRQIVLGGWSVKRLISGVHPTLSGETAKDGAPALLGQGQEKLVALCANAHLSDDETVAKMGHPAYLTLA
jgi:hypothetical protein